MSNDFDKDADVYDTADATTEDKRGDYDKTTMTTRTKTEPITYYLPRSR